jgi:hypothetical protein
LNDKKISIIATLHFDVIVRRVIALSLERRNLFFPAKKPQDAHWEVVGLLTKEKVVCTYDSVYYLRREKMTENTLNTTFFVF